MTLKVKKIGTAMLGLLILPLFARGEGCGGTGIFSDSLVSNRPAINRTLARLPFRRSTGGVILDRNNVVLTQAEFDQLETGVSYANQYNIAVGGEWPVVQTGLDPAVDALNQMAKRGPLSSQGGQLVGRDNTVLYSPVVNGLRVGLDWTGAGSAFAKIIANMPPSVRLSALDMLNIVGVIKLKLDGYPERNVDLAVAAMLPRLDLTRSSSENLQKLRDLPVSRETRAQIPL